MLALLFVTLPFVVRTVQPVLLELDQEMEQAAKSLGASELQTFRRIVFPNILPGILSGVALAFAKAVGEFGSLVIITGNLPYKTEVSSVFIFSRIESGDQAGAAAVAVVLLAISFALLLVDRRDPPLRDEARPWLAPSAAPGCAWSRSATSPRSCSGRSRSSSSARSRTASAPPGTRSRRRRRSTRSS